MISRPNRRVIDMVATQRETLARQEFRASAAKLAARVDTAQERSSAAYAAKPAKQKLVYGQNGSRQILGSMDVDAIQPVQLPGDGDPIDTKASADLLAVFDENGDLIGVTAPSTVTPMESVPTSDETDDENADAQIAVPVDGLTPPGATPPLGVNSAGTVGLNSNPSLSASGKTTKNCVPCGKPKGPSFVSKPAAPAAHSSLTAAGVAAQERGELSGLLAKIHRI
jgi:hypothetical protein